MYRSKFSRLRQQFEVSVQIHVPTALPPEKRALYTHCVGGRVCPRASLENITNSVALVSERQPHSAKLVPTFADDQCGGSLTAVISIF
jgi:hypothetical protein